MLHTYQGRSKYGRNIVSHKFYLILRYFESQVFQVSVEIRFHSSLKVCKNDFISLVWRSDKLALDSINGTATETYAKSLASGLDWYNASA